MNEVKETQENQIGVRLPNGQVKLFSHRHKAEDHARLVNTGLELAGLTDRAAVVRRHARHVTTTTATPWEVVRS